MARLAEFVAKQAEMKQWVAAYATPLPFGERAGVRGQVYALTPHPDRFAIRLSLWER